LLPQLSEKDEFQLIFEEKPNDLSKKIARSNFEIIKLIGKGGFSDVYEGK